MRLLKSALGLALAAGSALVAADPAAAATTPMPHAVGGFEAPANRVNASSGPMMRALDALPDSATLAGNLPPVGDQGQVSSCVAWTIAHTIMGYYAKRDGNPGAPYAPLYLYLRALTGGSAPGMGLYPDKALAEATANGVDTQDDYIQGTVNYQQPPTAGEIANAAKYKLAGWQTLWVGDKQGDKAKTAIKTAIAGGSPVAVGMPVFKDFMYLNSGKLYNTLTGSSLGGHMITAYAYDAEGVWIRNQWGTGWGAAGDAHLSWAFVTTDIQAAFTVSGLKTTATGVPLPTVTSLSATKGILAGGTKLTIAGANLSTVTGVRFGDIPATFSKTESNGATTLAVTAPAHAKGTVDVIVTNAGGSSVVTAADRFTYAPAAPVVTKLNVATASTLGGETVTVTGTDLAEASAVKVGSAAATGVKVASPTSLTFTVPAGLSAGGYDVTVTTPYGTSAATWAGRLTLVAPPVPTVSKLSVSSGSTITTTPVVVTGTGFGTLKSVTAGGTVLVYTKQSETQITVTMPAHAAGKVNLKLTNAGGAFEATSLPFTYVAPPAPVVSSVSPSFGSAKTSTTIELSGANLGTATKVTASNVSLTFTRISESKLRVVVPAHAVGTVTLQVTTPAGVSSTSPGATFTYRV
jgi:hypothetical protein